MGFLSAFLIVAVAMGWSRIASYPLPIPSVIAVIATYVVAALSSYLYERPFLRLKKCFVTKPDLRLKGFVTTEPV